MNKILVLFPKDWDKLHFAQAELRSRYQFFYEGFDLFSFPQNVRLLGFDLLDFVDRLATKYRRIGLDGILSNNEQFGALSAALLADRLGLRGLNPLTLITAQHKFYAREALKSTLPELQPDYCVFPDTVKSVREIPLPFPLFVKPVKATYSVLARCVDSFADLEQHLMFNPLETFIINRLVKPFNDVMETMTDFRIDAHHLIGESLLKGSQVSVDGLVLDGKITVLGVVDAIMYPGTQAFMRWDYPSRLSALWKAKVTDAAERVVRGLGYNHGFFNVELTVDVNTGDIKLIEVNPRMASQFSDLYEKVNGLSLHQIALNLCCGEPFDLQKQGGKYRLAASFVFRKFDGTPLSTPPTPDKFAWLASFDPDAHLMLYLKRGRSLAREMKWLGSHRYAVLNMGAESEAALWDKYRAVKQRFGFETGSGDLD